MEGLDLTLWPPTAWHWLAVGLVLLSLEMMLGTFDLLWVSIAAGLTSAYTAIAPDGIAGWQGQLVFFAIASTALFIMGRTLFRRMRENVEEHPTLNKRMAGTLGQRAVVSDDFTGGIGRVKLGDTVWSAQSIDGANLASGAAVIVEATEGNILKVRPA
ncbi:MAG: NfeD family protein [Hyphomonadaceae bacterium]|nr:NfeD family protein [Hyphomonadaceae bacterium]